mgnify:CR=1 FL=1
MIIDPISALEGLQSAISMVKKASKVANDLGGLAPMLGKMFDAKSTATRALLDAKKNKKAQTWGWPSKSRWPWSRVELSRKN